jgi:tripartite-type tricarboxylate transporter receptor subunit TctC
MSRQRKTFIALGFAALAALAATSARAQTDDVAQFYKGKTVTVVVGTTPGGGYDLYGRLVARHIGKYIPGNPTVVVSNMSGAASIVALQYILNVAPKDGSVMGAIYPGAIMEPLLGDGKVKYDAAKLNYIGSANSELYVCVARVDSGATNLDQFIAKDMIVGASQAGGSTRDFANLINVTLGAKLKVVSGYPGSNEITLAIEKNEVQGVCGIGWSSIAAGRPQWIDGDAVKIVAQEGLGSAPELDKIGVATVLSRAKTDEQRQLMELFYGPLKFGRPFVMAPTVPDARVAAFREAFSKAMRDPELQGEAKKMRVDAIEASGAEVQKLVAELYKSPPSVVEKARAISAMVQ